MVPPRGRRSGSESYPSAALRPPAGEQRPARLRPSSARANASQLGPEVCPTLRRAALAGVPDLCAVIALGLFGTSRADASVRGIDVSNWQGRIDLNAVAGSGSGSAPRRPRRATPTPTRGPPIAPARTTGLRFGAYHFARPSGSTITSIRATHTRRPTSSLRRRACAPLPPAGARPRVLGGVGALKVRGPALPGAHPGARPA